MKLMELLKRLQDRKSNVINNSMWNFIKFIFPYIINIIFIFILITMYHNMKESKLELEKYKQSIKQEKITEGINKPVELITDRETNIYPNINKNIETINKDIKVLRSELVKEENKKPTKGKIDAEFKKKSIDEVCKYLNDYGVSTTIYTSTGGK